MSLSKDLFFFLFKEKGFGGIKEIKNGEKIENLNNWCLGHFDVEEENAKQW